MSRGRIFAGARIGFCLNLGVSTPDWNPVGEFCDCAREGGWYSDPV